MNGPQHLAAANAALAKAEAEAGPRGDMAQFNKHMRLYDAHLAMAQFALTVAKDAGDGTLFAGAKTYSIRSRERSDALFANYITWIEAVTGGGAS